MDTTRAQTPVMTNDEADDDDDSSSAYGRAIRRIISRTRPELRLHLPSAPVSPTFTSGSAPTIQRQLSSSVAADSRSYSESINQDLESCSMSVDMSHFFNTADYENRSIYSITNESDIIPNNTTNISNASNNLFMMHDLRRLHRQLDTSFTTQNSTTCNDQELSEYTDQNYTNNYLNDGGTNMNTPCDTPAGSVQIERRTLRRGTLYAPPLPPPPPSSGGIPMSPPMGRHHQSYKQPHNDYYNNNNNNNNNTLRSRYKNRQQQQPRQSMSDFDTTATTRLGGSSFGGPGDLNSDSHSSGELENLDIKWSWRNLKREFKLSQSERLFHLYQAKLQQSFFVALLILNIIFNMGAIISYMISKYHEMNWYLVCMRVASIWVFISFLTLIWFNKLWMQSKFSRTVASLAVLLAMIFGEASGAICALVNDQATPLASIRRTYYLIITNHVFLPFPTRIQACAATIIITSFEIIVTYISRRDNNCRADYLTLYSIADIIFYLSSAMIGFQITFLLEIAIRRTFLNHKYCIQSTYKLNYEKEQQEQLLRSCFPQHLIEEVRGDVRELIVRVSKRQSEPFRPFKHLYVKKYENVTILYADIVNSMNLTDKLSPAELVETLNELYGRFDELAENFNCLRIKLLGDCYYCVSGLPEYDEDHAMKCLLMGLGMIKIIQSIRQSRNVDIDMRIGIHSGSVLSGLLGLRKWQFDIWSLDAMKASQMEHNGQPGFVHITQRTLDLISKNHARRKDLIITSTRQSDDSETTYLISERICHGGVNRASSDCKDLLQRNNGQSEKLKAYIEKLRVRPTTNVMDFTQKRMVLESSLKKYREIHEKVDETMKKAIADMPLGSAWKQFFFIDCLGWSEIFCRRNGKSKSSSSSSSGAKKKKSLSSRGKGNVIQLNRRKQSETNKWDDRRQRRNSMGAAVDIELAVARRSNTLAATNHTKAMDNFQVPSQRVRKSKVSISTAACSSTSSVTSGEAAAATAVRSPTNKALIQADPLFHLYLIFVGLITLCILAIKCLIPGMAIYTHTVIGFIFILVIIIVSTIYTQVKSRKINLQFRILLWLIISASLTMLQLVDLIVPDELDSLNIQSIADVSRADSLSCAFAWYYTFTIIVAMTATSIFIRINVWLKFIIHLSTIVFYIIINNPPATMMDTLREFLQTQNNNWSLLDHKQELSHLFYITMIAVILHLIDRQVEYILSLNIQWNEQLERDRIESETVGQINKMLLENILPPHVLKRYLYNTTVNYDQLYHESHPSCAVMFASIPNYENFYTENNLNKQGLTCLQVLNEIICDFDQLLSLPYFRQIEKIKTIGSTYMAACFDVTRRTSDCTVSNYQPYMDEITENNVVTMVRFASALMENLARMNKHAWQDFRLRIGIAIGPVIAGVVGATKPTYDIWGDTVNVASRLESSGVLGRIQVSEQVAQILTKNEDFEVECRGPIEVKGKGKLTTYLVRTPYDSMENDLINSSSSPLAPTTEANNQDNNNNINAHQDGNDEDDDDDDDDDEADVLAEVPQTLEDLNEAYDFENPPETPLTIELEGKVVDSV